MTQALSGDHVSMYVGKHPFASKPLAIRIAKKKRAVVYRCPFCSAWHVGHAK